MLQIEMLSQWRQNSSTIDENRELSNLKLAFWLVFLKVHICTIRILRLLLYFHSNLWIFLSNQSMVQDTCEFPDIWKEIMQMSAQNLQLFWTFFGKLKMEFMVLPAARKTTPGNCIMKAICLGVTPLLKVWYSKWLKRRPYK